MKNINIEEVKRYLKRSLKKKRKDNNKFDSVIYDE